MPTRAALALELAGLSWAPVFVDFFGGETRTPEFRALNVMGEVPVLVDGGVTLTQSAVMQTYVTEKTGKFGGTSAEEAREVLRWMFWDNHKLSTSGRHYALSDEFPAGGKAAGRGHHFHAGAAQGGIYRAQRASEGARVDRG